MIVADETEAAKAEMEAKIEKYPVPATDSSLTVDDCDTLTKDEEMARVVAAKDEEIASVVAAKDEEIASVVVAMDEELKQLRAQLERLEGVPPQRPDEDVQ